MRGIVERLHEKRQIERAKSLLESQGYSVLKINESEEDDEFDDWDPYQGQKYRVIGGDDPGIVTCTSDPKEAIEKWFEFGQDYPLDTAIMAKTKADAIELNKAATEDYLTELYSKYKCPYKLEYLIQDAEKKVKDGQRGFYEDKYGYGDSVHPFGVG